MWPSWWHMRQRLLCHPCPVSRMFKASRHQRLNCTCHGCLHYGCKNKEWAVVPLAAVNAGWLDKHGRLPGNANEAKRKAYETPLIKGWVWSKVWSLLVDS